MRYTFRFAVAAALTLSIGVVFADAHGPDFFRVTGVASDDVLNIRAEPDPRAEKVGEIPPDGTCVHNLGCQGGLTFREFTELSEKQKAQRLKENPRWCKVEYLGVAGWVAGRYLIEGTCDAEADQWFAETLAGGGDLSANYRAWGKVCGLQFQMDYFGMLAKDMEAHPESHVTADVDALQMKQEYERLVATDPEFAAAVGGNALQKQKAEDVQSINAAIEWLDKGTEGQRKLAGVVCRWMMNGIKEASEEPGPLNRVIVDFRNRALVDRIVADSHDKIYITYGAHHIEGVIPLLEERDPRWQVKSVEWIRPIEVPRHLEGEL